MITVKRFTAPWCAPCRMLAPVLSGLATEYPDVVFETVDVDAQPEVAQQYDIRSVPTVIIFKNDEIVTSIVGANAKQKYVDAIEIVKGAA
jgi:thioredoxin 1